MSSDAGVVLAVAVGAVSDVPEGEQVVQDSSYFFAKEREIQTELLDLAMKEKQLRFRAQLFATRAKQLYKQEQLALMGVPAVDRRAFDDSQEEVVAERGASSSAGGGGAPPVPGGESADNKKKRQRMPSGWGCKACWNLSMGPECGSTTYL